MEKNINLDRFFFTLNLIQEKCQEKAQLIDPKCLKNSQISPKSALRLP